MNKLAAILLFAVSVNSDCRSMKKDLPASPDPPMTAMVTSDRREEEFVHPGSRFGQRWPTG